MPKKHLGQHFLADPHILRRIVDFADPSPLDTIVEIGPGRGALTRMLADQVQRVIAIEVDPDLSILLALEAAQNSNSSQSRRVTEAALQDAVQAARLEATQATPGGQEGGNRRFYAPYAYTGLM